MEIVPTVGFVVPVGLNLVASRRSLRDALATPGQRMGQVLFVWLVPILGALVVLAVTRSAPKRSRGTYRSEPDVGAQYVTGFGRLNDRGYVRSPDDAFHLTSGGDASPD